METEKQREGVVYPEKFASCKGRRPKAQFSETPANLSVWVGRHLESTVAGARSAPVAEKAALHLGRFVGFFEETYGRGRISTVVRRGVRG